MAYSATTALSSLPDAPKNERKLGDAGISVTKAFDATPTNQTNTSGVDLKQAVPFPVTDKLLFQIGCTASANTANNKNINVWLQDSADNTTFANVAVRTIPFVQLVDNNGGGFAANTSLVQDYLPPTIKRYVRLACKGEANGGNAADANIVFSLKF